MYCDYCGEEFFPKRIGQVTCGKQRCKSRRGSYLRGLQVEQYACDVCGKLFSRSMAGTKSNRRKTCSDACSVRLKSRSCTKPKPVALSLPDNIQVDFAALTTGIREFPILDCPECDPMTLRIQHDGIWID